VGWRPRRHWRTLNENGILFLDELPEFARDVLEVLPPTA